MALTENIKVNITPDTTYQNREVASGAIHFYTGAICNYNTSGYLKLGSDTASEIFAGIAFDELDQASGGNNGDNSLKTIAAKSGVAVKLGFTGVTIADLGKDVFVNGDDFVALAGTTANDVRVGSVYALTANANEAIIVLD